MAILDLAGHGCPAGFREQRVGQAAQQQARHQVLEHRPAPRDQANPSRGVDVGPAKLEPVAARSISSSDVQVARQARLRGQQVIAGPVEIPVAEVGPDRVKMPFRLVQRTEVHRGAEGLGAIGQVEQPIAQTGSRTRLAMPPPGPLRRDRPRRDLAPGWRFGPVPLELDWPARRDFAGLSGFRQRSSSIPWRSRAGPLDHSWSAARRRAAARGPARRALAPLLGSEHTSACAQPCDSSTSFVLAADCLADPSEQIVGLTFQTLQPVIPGQQVAGLFLEDLLDRAALSP